MRRQTVTMLRPLALVVTALLSVPAALAGSEPRTIDTTQLHTMVVDNAYRLEGGKERQVAVIDARTKWEYDEGHIFSAISIPENEFERSMDLLPTDKSALLVVYDNDRGARISRSWAARAASAGYSNLAVYSDGFLIWNEKKMPVAPLRPGIR